MEQAILRTEVGKDFWFSVTASRSYKQGREWERFDSFGRTTCSSFMSLERSPRSRFRMSPN